MPIAHATHRLDLVEGMLIGACHNWRLEQIKEVLAVQVALAFERLCRGWRGECGASRPRLPTAI